MGSTHPGRSGQRPRLRSSRTARLSRLSRLSRPRRFRALALAVAMSVAGSGTLAACGDDDGGNGGGGGGSAATPLTPASTEAEADAFPAEVEHRFGTTEITEEPERVVTLGLSDHDSVLALGVYPVAVTYWYGDYAAAAWPWAQDELGDAESLILNDGEFTGTQQFNYEEIALQRPDVIIGLYTGMTEEEYDRLSEIAPTVAPSGDYPDYGMPWEEMTRMVGQTLGRPQQAEDLIAGVEAQFAEAAAAHPEFQGLEAVVAEVFDQGSSFARSATDPRTRFMEALGFVLPQDIAELAGEEDGAEISDEEMQLLDRDLLVWNVGSEAGLREQVESKPLYPQLEVVRQGHVVYVEDEIVSGALTWATVLSLPYALENLLPQITEAVAGGAA